MKKLTGTTKELDVLSIFGMPGLGKTTLARKVYNNPCIVNHFDVKVWCAVSQAYNRTTLLVEIFKQAINKECKIKENDNVADMLRKILIGKRYLIVLDDIWEVEAWEDLRLCFPRGENGCRVMVTTRIEQVAKHIQHRSDPYSLRFLTMEESWVLLQKKVFRGENCPSNLVKAGLQIAQHCKGLPLVVVLIAGIIAKMRREASLWLEVANDLSSLALGEQSMKVIQSSYDHLEDHLKPCLLYMALFPEDHKIAVDDLLKLWMAEEFVLNVETENMEEASRVCLNDLLNRSLVMVSTKKINGDIARCILHDVVHHYEYQLDKITMLESKESTKCFGECSRSLEFIAHPNFNPWNKSNPLPLLVKLKLVRVLHFPYEELPSSWPIALQSLTYLRYLEISVEEFDFERISHLLDLQTLVVRSSKFRRTSPATIWKMKKLRHVNVNKLSLVWDENDKAIFEESSTTMLENLKTLHVHTLRVDDMNRRFWWRFANLEELSLRVEAFPSCPLFPSVEVHTRLQSLDLVISPLGFLDSVGWESYFVFPSNLRHLRIGGCFLTKEMILNIARLKKLQSLTLEGGFPPWKSEYTCWDVTNVELPALKYLALHFVRMEEWKASEDSFPVLEELSIRTGYFYKEIPPSFADIPTLRLIKLYDYTESLGVSAMTIKKEIEENTGCDSLQVLLL
ncbi:hypothetical protein RDI58_015805 [Solanum bulbocastanum]|uniref:Uncharacterized protein n=1 Tax=Solanum bulbocastanum TaxID=147425 RepID=A0AAN8TG99_SOLBU